MDILLTPALLLETVRDLRAKVIGNAHRIPKARSVADKLGQIETTLVEDFAKQSKENDDQEDLTFVDVDADLRSTGHEPTPNGKTPIDVPAAVKEVKERVKKVRETA